MIVEPEPMTDFERWASDPPRVLLTGSRHWTDWEAVNDILQEYPEGTVFIHGGARGLDSMAEQIAVRLGFKTEVYYAQWNAHGLGAGPSRNQEMLDKGKPTECVAFPLPDSKGTLDMIRRVVLAGLPLRVWDLTREVEHVGAWVRHHVHWLWPHQLALREAVSREYQARYGREPFPAEFARILAEMELVNESDPLFRPLPYQVDLLRSRRGRVKLRTL